MPLISVIIPVFNRKELLPRALLSVLKQSFTDFELIVVDDGSTDGVEELPILTSDPRIQYIKLDSNYGVSKARNTGISHSSGKWIALLDSDDEWTVNKLKKQLLWLRANPSFRITQSKEIWIRNGKRVNPPSTHEKFQGDLFSVSLQRCMITPSSVIFDRELFFECGPFNESLPACEDYDLWLRITCRYPIGLVPEFHLTRYGGHQDQLSSIIPILDRYRIRSILQLLYHSQLTPQQRSDAISICTQKASIIADGCLKRGNQNLYLRYQSIASRPMPVF
jgi:glycosyltransferase involved in cell wall biosynthesis